MSSEMEKYKAHVERLGLTPQQGKELIGALQCIVENILNKKYLLEELHESARSEISEGGHLLPRVQ